MNERIKELAIEAGAGEWGDSIVPAMMDIEKFAQLIIEDERMMACELIDAHAKALKVAILNGGE